MTDLPLAGALRAYGPWSQEIQRLVRLHCERGNVQPMVESLADHLLQAGIVSGEIPSNAGLKTKDLLDRTEAAVLRTAQSYNDRGGVLTAKGYASVLGLAAEMAKQWLKSFSPPIPVTTFQPGTIQDPEIQDRLTVVALKLQGIIMEKAMASEHNVNLSPELHTLIIKNDDLEYICHKAALEMFRAFTDPNTANHELIHKETL